MGTRANDHVDTILATLEAIEDSRAVLKWLRASTEVAQHCIRESRTLIRESQELQKNSCGRQLEQEASDDDSNGEHDERKQSELGDLWLKHADLRTLRHNHRQNGVAG